MTKRPSKKLVIDASVARAAGEESATHLVSKQCRDFLKAVLDICHHIIFTPDISEEWKKHKSNFSHRWLSSMYARKKVFRLQEVGIDLSATAQDGANNSTQEMAMLKDICLLEAALSSDFIVVSLDDTVKVLFSELAAQTTEIKEVMWINPTVNFDVHVIWLGEGAPIDSQQKL
ncbi:MAG: hypothetical protein GY796_33630 [Chloroflexi bacterium]|nr:hypothetical protein [Chloroflexota bacterium]